MLKFIKLLDILVLHASQILTADQEDSNYILKVNFKQTRQWSH